MSSTADSVQVRPKQLMSKMIPHDFLAHTDLAHTACMPPQGMVNQWTSTPAHQCSSSPSCRAAHSAARCSSTASLSYCRKLKHWCSPPAARSLMSLGPQHPPATPAPAKGSPSSVRSQGTPWRTGPSLTQLLPQRTVCWVLDSVSIQGSAGLPPGPSLVQQVAQRLIVHFNEGGLHAVHPPLLLQAPDLLQDLHSSRCQRSCQRCIRSQWVGAVYVLRRVPACGLQDPLVFGQGLGCSRLHARSHRLHEAGSWLPWVQTGSEDVLLSKSRADQQSSPCLEHCAGYDALLCARPAALHGVRLACTCLPIAEDAHLRGKCGLFIARTLPGSRRWSMLGRVLRD